MFALQETSAKTGTYIDVRSVPTAKLEEYCKTLSARAQRIRVVSLGDEISLPAPGGAKGNADMIGWLQRQGLKPADILPGAANWNAIKYNPPMPPRLRDPACITGPAVISTPMASKPSRIARIFFVSTCPMPALARTIHRTTRPSIAISARCTSGSPSFARKA